MNYLTRRALLRFAAGAGIAASLEQISPAYAEKSLKNYASPTSTTSSINLKVQKTQIKVNQQTTEALTVDGSVPGPLVRLKEGQFATINVENKLEEDTSIHWHGLILPMQMDGVPGVSFAGIKPGQTFTYRFPVKQNGTYWYHSHSGLQEQQGHFGPIIIDPLEPEPFDYDRDYVVMLSDWTFENPHRVLSNLKKMPAYYNYQRRTIANLGEDAMWQRMRMDPTDIADVTGATYTYLLNGKAPGSNWTGLFKPGEKIRLRFINASAMTYFDIRIPGLKMTVVQADGQNIQPVSIDEFRIAVAETYDVIVEPETEEAYTIFAETMDRSGYARGTLAVSKGLEAPIPKQRERPLRTMSDMGMAMSDMKDMPSSSMAQKNAEPMSNMDMPKPNPSDKTNAKSGTSNMSGSGSGMSNMGVPHGPDNHGPGNAGVAMVSRSRLDEPGVGLVSRPGHRVLVYNDLRSLSPLPDQRPPSREVELHLTGNMERYMWSFDGKKYAEVKNHITFYNGERLRLILVNDTMMEHPIHLHGMWMELENNAGSHKPRKHTINVKPAERIALHITVDAPGEWAFHCHLLYHMKLGMFRTVAVVDRTLEVS